MRHARSADVTIMMLRALPLCYMLPRRAAPQDAARYVSAMPPADVLR